MTLLGVLAKNHPQQVGRRGADDSTDDRRTPDELWMKWHGIFGFTLDVAASPENAKCPAFYTIENDALSLPWTGSVWCNPPYSNLEPWVKKAWDESWRSRPSAIVMLVPANRTEQGWWQRHIEPTRDHYRPTMGVDLGVHFLPGRIRFTRPGWTKPTKGDRPPFGLCLLVWQQADAPRRLNGLTP